MRLTRGVIEELAALLTSTPVRSACERVGVRVGSYYRWHWEARRRFPNAVDTAYETQKTSLLQGRNISIADR